MGRIESFNQLGNSLDKLSDQLYQSREREKDRSLRRAEDYIKIEEAKTNRAYDYLNRLNSMLEQRKVQANQVALELGKLGIKAKQVEKMSGKDSVSSDASKLIAETRESKLGSLAAIQENIEKGEREKAKLETTISANISKVKSYYSAFKGAAPLSYDRIRNTDGRKGMVNRFTVSGEEVLKAYNDKEVLSSLGVRSATELSEAQKIGFLDGLREVGRIRFEQELKALSLQQRSIELALRNKAKGRGQQVEFINDSLKQYNNDLNNSIKAFANMKKQLGIETISDFPSVPQSNKDYKEIQNTISEIVVEAMYKEDPSDIMYSDKLVELMEEYDTVRDTGTIEEVFAVTKKVMNHFYTEEGKEDVANIDLGIDDETRTLRAALRVFSIAQSAQNLITTRNILEGVQTVKERLYGKDKKNPKKNKKNDNGSGIGDVFSKAIEFTDKATDGGDVFGILFGDRNNSASKSKPNNDTAIRREVLKRLDEQAKKKNRPKNSIIDNSLGQSYGRLVP